MLKEALMETAPPAQPHQARGHGGREHAEVYSAKTFARSRCQVLKAALMMMATENRSCHNPPIPWEMMAGDRGGRQSGRWLREAWAEAAVLRCSKSSRGTLCPIMPRHPRLDAPDTLHHVLVRGIERTRIVRDDADRADFVARVAALAEQGAWTIYAWALLPNHAHLLVRTGTRPLPRSMRSLLTGYAGAFNRRHKRVGHLFQNRYKSIVVEEDPYLLELVRYLHLNPLRAQVVPDLCALARYPWTGHSALLGTVPCPWQDSAAILAQFGANRRRAIPAYRAFVAEGIPRGRRAEFQGGGLLRSHGGWAAVVALRRGREAYQGDERILGSSEFVEGYRRAVAAASPTPPQISLEALIARVCRHVGVPPVALAGGGRTPSLTRARAGMAYLWVEVLGRSGRALAPALGVHSSAIPKAARRGALAAAEWSTLLSGGKES